jgi:hypothetical protein
MSVELPNPDDVATFLRELLDRPIKVSKGKPERVGKKVSGSCGVYRHDDNTLAAAWVCDHGFGASAGAALSLIPAAAAKDLLKAEGMNGALRENLQEVFNIGASLFNDGKTHVRYTEMVVDDRLPDDIAEQIKGSKKRLDVAIDVGGYEKGWLAVIAF